jgi:hypothetical protein
MIATSATTERLHQADAALGAALSNLLDALESFRAAGRADVAGPLRSAVRAAHQAELLRRTAPAQQTGREPADWFLD